MIFKKGFLLIELMVALLLVSLCITFFMVQHTQVGILTRSSFQTHQQLMTVQSALEKMRALKKECHEFYISENYQVEVRAMRDDTIKNFLHITVTLYDEYNKKNLWFSGVALSQ